MTEEVILEPGDPGYVAPNEGDVPPAPPVDPPPPGPVENQLPTEPPTDLTHQQQPGESDASFRARTAGFVVDSQNPTDLVPNMPQTTMGVRVQVPESDPPVYVGVPPETLEEPEEPEEEVVVEGEGEGEVTPTDTSASALISRAQAATTNAELDEIEAQANGRTTVVNAVAARRAELAQ